MTVRILVALPALASMLLLGGCGMFNGRQGSGPDEFAVVTRAPLSLPPDYGLRPPRPGAARPGVTTPRDDAEQKLLTNIGGRSRQIRPDQEKLEDDFTRGESALLKQANALKVDPEIRHQIERENTRVKEEDSLVEKLVFWRDDTQPKTVVEPTREAQRLRENAALGKPPTEGSTPTVETK